MVLLFSLIVPATQPLELLWSWGLDKFAYSHSVVFKDSATNTCPLAFPGIHTLSHLGIDALELLGVLALVSPLGY